MKSLPKRRFRQILLLSLTFLAFSNQGISSPQQHYSNGYPPEGGTEYEQSVITIPIYDPNQSKDSPVEILKLTAFMRLEREAPITNGLGYRQVEFTIADWELYGYSEYFDADITFTLSEVPVQPKSLVIALQEGSDYPSNIIYNAIYDVWIGQKRVVKDKPGIAFTKNVFEIPPRNVSVAFQKPTKFTEEHVELFGENSRVKSANRGGCIGCPPPFFDDGTCEDMLQITQKEYELGKQVAYEVRSGKRSLKDTYYSR